MSWLSLFIGLLPCVVLLATLFAGRYPGERVLGRMRRAAGPRPSAIPSPMAVRFLRVLLRRRGELLAGALAGRSPPSPSRGALTGGLIGRGVRASPS
jgi:hypothetical protein